jgi:membrane protein YdbS with pleckstrin-like domain
MQETGDVPPLLHSTPDPIQTPEPQAFEQTPTTPPFLENTYQSLDPRIIPVWRLGRVLGTLLSTAILSVGAVILSTSAAGSAKWLAIGLLIWLLYRLILIVWHPKRAYKAWSYRLDQSVLEIRYGIWWKTIQLLPLSRLQHADIQKGPLERRYGLASLHLYTAGTHSAVLTIPGLNEDHAIQLRDHLVKVGGDDGV